MLFRFSGLKTLQALMVIGVVGGVVVAYNDVASVKAPLPAEEAAAVAGVQNARNGAAMLTADEREAKKREFFAKAEVKEMSAGLEEIAQAVAVAVEDKTLRDRIYAKCMEKFDGETNVLWQQLDADANLRSKGGWSKKMDDLVGKGRKNSTVKGIGNVDMAIKKFEKVMNAPVHLFWAFPENWDKKTTPIVAIMPMTSDPEKHKTIPAFDAKGNRIELSNHDATVAKQRPVIVVTYNERSDVSGTVRAGVMVGDRNGVITPLQPTTNNPDDKKGSSSLSSVATKMKITAVKVPSSTHGSEDEPWGEGGTEWIVCVDNYSFGPPGGYFWNGQTTRNLGAYASSYAPNFSYTIGPTLHLHIKYFEDDFTPAQYDIFDDWWGWHIIDGIGGAPIQANTYNKTESFWGGVSTDATYVLE